MMPILFDKFRNKGTAFTREEREAHGISNLLPWKVETLDEQIDRVYRMIQQQPTRLQKWLVLYHVQNTNETLFYATVLKHIDELLGVVYTPTVGDACTDYSRIFTRPRGMYFSLRDKGMIRRRLDNWKNPVDAIVVSDGTRILGLGDLGVGGHGITVGKLSLYTCAAGFHPERVLPISLDTGTRRDDLREDSRYLGIKEGRAPFAERKVLVDELVWAVQDKWPECVFQFEDFSNDTAFDFLEAHRYHGLAVFNDDIQGTGCITAAVFLAALKSIGLTSETKKTLMAKDQRFVFLGAGAGGVGVADCLAELLVEEGLSWEEAREKFWLIDSRGLITQTRADFKAGKLAKHKVPYAKKVELTEGKEMNLLEAVKFVKPTALIGLSTIANAFNAEVLKALDEGCPHQKPVVFALSNPTIKTEVTNADCYKFLKDRCIYASGSPQAKVTRADGVVVNTTQCNNFFVFPAIGLAASIAKASEVPQSLFSTISHRLADLVPEEKLMRGECSPEISDIRDITVGLTVSGIKNLVGKGVARCSVCKSLVAAGDDEQLTKWVRSKQWEPVY
eukprot:gnl/Carplike_NY0171/1179_a1595_1186.p1 GENE.gnl/Carplike_NY0171/1179_a1595_1186~~gnl/Carplike_NY0171/1179_a1595_1186.p1  ORF type:complete len:574 (+),score=222.25 gnl/Carplike_NY0171/1179_a1595_1186:38-1723(+)